MKLDHINVSTDDLLGVRNMFVEILGLEEGDRPPFDFAGYWLYGSGNPVVHLTKRETDPGNTTGALDHVAFSDDDYDGLISRLEKHGIEYDARSLPGTGARQIFFKINHDVKIEVGFDPAS